MNLILVLNKTSPRTHMESELDQGCQAGGRGQGRWLLGRQ
jgi:hypothetical protein